MAPTTKDRAVLKTHQNSSTHTISIKEEQFGTCGKTNGRKPGRDCSFCHQYFHLTCVSPKLSKITSASLTTWMCSNCTNLPICNLPISSENQTQVTTFGKSSSDTVISSSRFLQGYRILLMIPKGSRVLVAETLVETIDGALNDPNNSLNWEKLFNFAKLILAVPRNPDSASKPNLFQFYNKNQHCCFSPIRVSDKTPTRTFREAIFWCFRWKNSVVQTR